MHFNSTQEYLRYFSSSTPPVEPEKYVEPEKEETPKEEREEKPARLRRVRKA